MKKILNIVIWIFLVSGLVVSLAFVEIEQKKMKCSSLQIEINHEDGNYFVEAEDVKSIIFNTGDSVKNQALGDIKIAYLEKIIDNHASVANAQVFKTIDGQVKVRVKQRFPILRVFNARDESFYIDQEGYFMPLSSNYTSRVLVANGRIYAGTEMLNKINVHDLMRVDSIAKKTIVDDLFILAKYISADEWRKAQFQQIYIDENGEFELIPRVGNHRILIGDITDIEEKIEKLKTFYIEGLSKTGWNEYHTINLKFKNQVVCTKI